MSKREMTDREVAIQMFTAMTSAFSCLASELSKAGHLDYAALIENLQRTAIATRDRENATYRAALIDSIAQQLLTSIPENPATPPQG